MPEITLPTPQLEGSLPPKNILFKITINRFLRGFLSSLVPMLATFTQVGDWTYGAILAVIISAMSGGLLALDKFLREIKFY